MSWRYHGHVKVNARNPMAAGRCDRCGFLYNHNKLRFQFDWAGQQLQNLRILVCDHCYDEPQRQLGSKVVGPDPLPIWNARPEPFTFTGYSYDESNIMTQPDPTQPFGTHVDGYQMLMPDGVTTMLMPDNPGGSSSFSNAYSDTFS